MFSSLQKKLEAKSMLNFRLWNKFAAKENAPGGSSRHEIEGKVIHEESIYFQLQTEDSAQMCPYLIDVVFDSLILNYDESLMRIEFL